MEKRNKRINKRVVFALIITICLVNAIVHVGTANGTAYLGWADKYYVGMMNVIVHDYDAADAVAYSNFWYSDPTGGCPVGVQAISTKGNANTRVAYFQGENETSACGTVWASLERRPMDTVPSCGNVSDTDVGNVEHTVTLSTSTCGWGDSATFFTTDWTPLEISHSYSSPSTGLNGYRAYFQTGWDFYASVYDVSDYHIAWYTVSWY